MTEKYILKHKDKPVLLFDLNTENYVPVEIFKIYDIQRLPFVLDNDKDLKLGVALLSRWIENRGITESRDDYERLMEENHTSSGRELSINSLGLNLTDHYWIHNINQDLNWEKLNFFDHSFNKKNMERIYPSNENAPIILNPNFSVDGCLIKEWVTDGKDRVLLKEGEVGFKQEPYNEVIATNIMNLLNIQNVGYSLKTIGDKIVSACKCMINRDTELWYARNVFDLDKNSHKHNYQKYIELCTKNGITDVQKKLDEMIVIDFIIGNTDRHTRNFGIIREAETLKWIKIAPIYDCGNSLFYRDPIKSKLEWNLDSFCKWTNLTNMELLKNIETFDWYNEAALKKIPKIINAGLKLHDLLDSKKISMITNIVELRIKTLKQIYERKVKYKSNIKDNNKCDNNDDNLINNIQIATNLEQFVYSKKHINMKPKQISECFFTNIINDRNMFENAISGNYHKVEIDFSKGYYKIISKVCDDVLIYFNNGNQKKNYLEIFEPMEKQYLKMEKELRKNHAGYYNEGMYKAVLALKNGLNKTIKIIKEYNGQPPPPPPFGYTKKKTNKRK